MKILWLSHLIPYPPKGGVLQRAYHMLRELSKYHDIDLLAFTQESLIASMFENIEEGLIEARSELKKICDHVEFVSIESTEGRLGRYGLALRSLFAQDTYTINWLKSQQYALSISSLIDSTNYDLVHFDTISLVPYEHLIQGTPTVLDHHNVESHMLIRRAENESNILKKWYFNQEGVRLERFERHWCPRFSLNIMCSDTDRARLQKISPDSRIDVVPNGVDVDYFVPNMAEIQSLSIIFVGTLNWYPNVEAVRFIIYELWPLLKKEVPEISVDIIGANPPTDICKTAASDDRINVHGFVDDIRDYIAKATVYVCPISDGGGTKLKILDALAMGKAIIAHPIACEGIQVSDGQNVMFATTAAEYLEGIKRLASDSATRQHLGTNARKLAEDIYCYSKIGASMSELFEKTASSASHDHTR